MNKKKNNRKIISVLIVLACFVLFAGVLFTGIRNYKTEKKENPVQGVRKKCFCKTIRRIISVLKRNINYFPVGGNNFTSSKR